MVGIYVNTLADLEKKVMNNFGKNRISFYNTLFMVITRIVTVYIFVVCLDMGITGTGVSNLITSVLGYLALVIYELSQPDLKEVIALPTRQAFAASGIWEYVKLGAPSTAMICLDWWIWEFMIYFSGLFGVS